MIEHNEVRSLDGETNNLQMDQCTSLLFQLVPFFPSFLIHVLSPPSLHPSLHF